MAGGLGRAQGGYDETVFRAMVRDEILIVLAHRALLAGSGMFDHDGLAGFWCTLSAAGCGGGQWARKVKW